VSCQLRSSTFGLCVLALLALAPASAAGQEAARKLDRYLATRLAEVPNGSVPVLIAPRPPPAATELRLPAPGEVLPRPERHRRAVHALRANAAAAQAGVLTALEGYVRTGRARSVDPLWIANYVRAEVTPDVLAELTARPDVERIYLDRAVALVSDLGTHPAAAPVPAGQPSSAVEAVRVDEAWALGITGKGMLLANLDSGVQGDHPALAGKWRGLRVPVEQAWFDPFRNSTFPVDDDPVNRANGHGTATMGLLVGGEGTVGVAFDGEWIAANIFENNQSFVSTILKGLQWATDPDGDPATTYDVPDVINASFGLMEIDSTGVPTDTGLCDDVFDEAVDAAGAAGAVVVFSAGNFNVPDPGDITSPASSPNAFGVGAVDDQGNIAGFSGRGPSLCAGPDPTKPDVVAPGRSVRTLNKNGGEQTLSGTSFSAPIAAGIAALVRQKNPLLPAAEVVRILEETATDLGPPGPDNTFGAGRVDALAAVSATQPPGPVLRLTGVRRAGTGAGGRKLAPHGAPPEGFFLVPGENSFLVRLTNPGQSPTPAGRATLASRSPLVQVVDGEADLPGLSGLSEAELAFRVQVSPATPPGADLGFTLRLPVGTAPAVQPFTLVAGEPVEGQFATHDANEIRMTLTNFGGIGFWLGVSDVLGRQNELLGDGFHFPAEDETNYLFHGSFLVGRSPAQVSDDLPYGNVAQSVNDFHVLPGAPFAVLQPGPTAAQEVLGSYDDSYNLESELGVAVGQRSYAFDEEGRRDFVLVTYDVTNRTSAPLTNLHFGLFADWDFLDAQGDPQETMDFVPEVRLGVVQGSAGTPSLGLVVLNAVSLSDLSYRIIQLEDFKAAGGGLEIQDADKFEFLSGGVPVVRVRTPQDLAHLIAFGPQTITPGDSFQAAFAFVAGRDLAELRQAAARARSTYETEVLGREPPPGGVPEEPTLSNPFPNPLLPGLAAVTLEFGIPAAGDLGLFAARTVELRVLDVRGRVVRTLVEGELAPGNHERSWDGLDDGGRAVASGVYAVLLEVGGERRVRKLVVVR
jgi:hypothetical protein